VLFRSVHGTPRINISWLRDGKPLETGENKTARVTLLPSSKLQVSSGYLIIGHSQSHSYNGNYTLIAENPMGTVNKTVNVVVIVGPGCKLE
jgi:neurotrophic tyrosine kinase receptor type 3